MEVKSWQIAATGTVIQSLILVSIPLLIKGGDRAYAALDTAAGIASFIIGSLVTSALYFEKTRKIGAMLGVLVGVWNIIFIFAIARFNLYELILSTGIWGLLGISTLIAAIYYFKKENPVKTQ